MLLLFKCIQEFVISLVLHFFLTCCGFSFLRISLKFLQWGPENKLFLSESFHKEQGKKLAVSALLFQALVFSTERTAFTLLWPLLPWGSHLLVCHFLEGHVFPTLAAFKNLLECSFMIICGFFVYLAWFGWASPISWLHEYWETVSEQHPSPSILSAVSPGLPDLYFLVSSLSVNTSLENPVARCCSL